MLYLSHDAVLFSVGVGDPFPFRTHGMNLILRMSELLIFSELYCVLQEGLKSIQKDTWALLS